MKAAAAVLGLLMLAVPALSSPAQALAVTGAGVLLVTASLMTRSGWRAPAGTLAAGVAVIQCAVWRPGTLGLAAEGLLIAGYLILLGGPRRAGRAVTIRWLQGQLPSGIAALTAVGVVTTMLAVPAATSPWIFLTGLAAAVAAYQMALPRRPRSPR